MNFIVAFMTKKRIRSYVDSIEKFYVTIKKDEMLYPILKHKLQQCEKLFNIKNDIYKNKSIENVSDESFSKQELMMLNRLYNNEYNYFSNIDLYEFFVLFDNYKDIFIKPMLEIADIETYIGIHDFINSPEQKGHWCMAEFVEDNDFDGKPYLYAQEVWNPFLSPSKAVKNTIELGGNSKNSKRFAVLSGINYGGKTTLMNAITYAIIMSHLFGVAPAKKFKTSRFAKIHVMNSGDTDIAHGDSKFSKEIRLCSILLDQIHSAKEGDNIWINSDEMFSGTDPENAGKLCKWVMEEAGNSSERTMGTYATHYSPPTELANEKNSCFQNYYMECNVDEKDDITFTRKLNPGKPKKSIAKYLLRKIVLKDKIPYFDNILKRLFPENDK